ncbi:hypothetical protein GQX74_012409 [Glossina fuscipes]|nr:hypothetical protein GQX74_012409 [Glossina fuscipes]
MKYDKLLETPERKLKFLPWDMPITFNAETANQPGKTATIEMYAPSSYNDTVTGETLSSVSEKSESYSNDGSQGDYIDEARKKAASTYLVENSDLPPPPRYQQDGTLPALYPNNMVTVNISTTFSSPATIYGNFHIKIAPIALV